MPGWLFDATERLRLLVPFFRVLAEPQDRGGNTLFRERVRGLFRLARERGSIFPRLVTEFRTWKSSRLIPVLAAVAVPFNIWGRNAGEIEASHAAPVVLSLALLFYLAAICLARLTGSRFLSDIWLGILALVWFSYSDLRHLCRLRVRYEILLGLLAVLGLSWFLSRQEVRLQGPVLNRFSLVVIGLIAGIQTVPLIQFHVEQLGLDEQAQTRLEITEATNASADIFIIILDAHGGTRVIEDHFDYSKSAFNNTMRDFGFYVADESQSPYDETVCSIPAVLNVKYWSEEDLGPTWGHAKARLKALIEDSVFFRAARSAGYEVRFVGSHPLVRPDAPGVTHFRYFRPSAFYYALVQRTPLKWFRVGATFNRDGEIWDPESVKWSFEILRSMLKEPRDHPVAVLAHIFSPHRPFYFDPEGEVVDAYRTEAWYGEDRMEHIKAAYVSQIRYLEKEVLSLVEALMQSRRGAAPPVVLIQGDHGPRFGSSEPSEFEMINFSTLNVALAPEQVLEALYPSVSTVNVAGLVFQWLFGLEYAPVKNESFHVEHGDNRSSFRFVSPQELLNLSSTHGEGETSLDRQP